jgi:ribosomal protein S6
MEKETKNYEIGFLTSGEEDIKEVTKELDAHKAKILNPGKSKKVNLAYKIEKQSVAFFTYIQFNMDPAQVESLSNKLKLNSKILRFMVINLPAIAMKAQKEMEKPTEQPENHPVKQKSSETPKKASSDDFVNNELLEKKLEEILK